jgi:hypothetical protein
LSAASCGTAPHTARRRYAIDPWGTAYWIRYTSGGKRLTVYSFGPNRRRDEGGDDIVASQPLRLQ